MCLFLHQHQQVMAPAQGASGGDGPAHQLAHESNMPPNQALGQPLPINDEPGGGVPGWRWAKDAPAWWRGLRGVRGGEDSRIPAHEGGGVSREEADIEIF